MRVLFFLIISALFGFQTSAQTKDPKKQQDSVLSKVPNDLKKMLDEFSEALAKKDKAKASELSHFPLKNIVYEAKQTKTQKEFESSLEDSTQGFCYGVKMPEKEKNNSNWALDCDGNVFYFGKISGKWKYLGYENINE